jgi:tripartite-type tricarboxylate transporter receptor subunit TctC
MNWILTLLSIWFAAVSLTDATGFAAEAPFYKGQTLTMIINYAAGGPTDIEGRLIARHLNKHIPGQPTIVVNNMAGAGGPTANNYLGEVAKPDGFTMGYFTGQFFNLLTADPSLRVDLSKFAYVASVEGVSVAYIRKDVAPGMNDPKDIAKAQRFKAGGLSINSTKNVRLRLQLDLLGVPYQYVTGYNSNSDARLALERNEIQFFTEGTPAYRSQVQPRLVKTGMVIPVYSDELVNADGVPQPSTEATDIPIFSHVYQQIHGKPASGLQWDTLRTISMPHAVQRVAMLPPGSPPAAVAALRQAFAALAKDQEFIADYQKATRAEPKFSFGDEADKLIKRLVAAPTEVRSLIKKYTQPQ